MTVDPKRTALQLGKVETDVLWTLASYAILGISGVAINVLIGRFYSPSALGVFNQVFAVYIFLSQFAAFGIHYSTVKHVAEYADRAPIRDPLISAAIVLTAVCATVTTCATWLARDAVGDLFQSDAVGAAMVYALPGLWCFALNKTLLGVLNGLRHMRAFAVGQALRYGGFVCFTIGCVLLGVPDVQLPGILSAGEVLLLCFLVAATRGLFRPVAIRRWDGWASRHFSFGLRSFLSGTMTEINTRVDVVMLGIFSTDRLVGIYSMAALLMEGLAELPNVLRTNLNPLLTQLIARDAVEDLHVLIRQWKRRTYVVMAAACALAFALYPVFIIVVVGDPDFLEGWWPFGILLLGLFLASGYRPFDMLLLQAGLPQWYTALKMFVVLSNVVLNAILIPRLGISGAAAATGLAFLASVVCLRRLATSKLGLSL